MMKAAMHIAFQSASFRAPASASAAPSAILRASSRDSGSETLRRRALTCRAVLAPGCCAAVGVWSGVIGVGVMGVPGAGSGAAGGVGGPR